jgi:ferrochelatase
MNYGGPERAEDCRPYLRNIFMDPDLIPIPSFVRPLVASLVAKRRAPVLQQNYEAMGQYSPTLVETTAQAEALERALGAGYSCFVAMRYWKPFISEVSAQIVREDFKRILLLPVYPHESRTTTGSSINEARRCLKELGYSGEILELRSFWDEPGYLGSLTAQVSEALAASPEGTRVLFSSHGLPVSVARKDLYPGQVLATVAEICLRLHIALDEIAIPGVMPALPGPAVQEKVRREKTNVDDKISNSSLLTPHSSRAKGALAWQSKVGPMKWLEPSVETVLEAWADEGVKHIVLVPVAFVNEHSETLYELDVLYGGSARSMGMAVKRLPTLGVTSAFIDGLAALVKKACAPK